MKMSLFNTLLIFTVAFVFGLTSITGSNSTCAQSIYHTNDIPGGGSGSGGSSSSGSGQSSGTTLFIVFGVAVAALIAYKYLIADNKPDKDKGKSDSTSTGFIFKEYSGKLAAQNLTNNLTNKLQDLPVNLYFGFRNESFDLRKKIFVLGLEIKI